MNQSSPLGLVAADGSIVPYADLLDNIDYVKTITGLRVEISTLKDQLTDRDNTIDTLRAQLSPALCEIWPSIMTILADWVEAAITAADPKAGIYSLVQQLESTGKEPPSWNQCDRISALFRQICELSGVQPLIEQVKAIQSVLDAGCSTGPVSPDKFNFYLWIKSEEV